MMSDAWVDSRSGTITRAIGKARDEIIIIAPDMETLRGISMVEGVEWPRNVRLLTTQSRVKELRREFLTATRIADLIGEGHLEFRTTIDEEALLQPLLITSDDLTCLLLPGQEDIAAVRTDVEDVFHYVRGEYLSMWGSAQSADLRTPSYSTILKTIGEEFEDSMQTDAETMLKSSIATRALDDRFDEIHAFVLLAAKNGEQYYELTRWGERVGLGSSARFSSRKKELEDAGLIGTEKVETGTVGRPRQRLTLTDSKLQNASVQQIITAAQSII